uniref:Mitochondrial import receptor subunit TOM5 homolog n=1 Tax=Stomoxys calcitrans TaxID=35570 RepID=A0A1I8PBM6_STOCA
MFRMPPQIDPAEEKRRVQADVRNNFIMFSVICAAIRLAPYCIGKAMSNQA